MATNANQVTPVPPGFGLQSADVDFFQSDSTLDKVVTLSPNTITPVQLNTFNNLDVVTQWFLGTDLNVTAPTGTTNTASAIAPYSALESVVLNVQNTFYPINTSGIDLYIKNTLWPWYPKARWNSQLPTTTQTYPAVEQRLLGADSQTITSSNIVFNDLIPIGPSMRFDSYAHIDFATGNTLAINGQVFQRAYVGTQLLGGTNRTIFPKVNFNPIVGSNTQNGLYTVTGTQTAAASGTATLNTYREGYYNLGPGTYPSVTDWVPIWQTFPITVGSQSTWVYDLPKTYQILGVVLRFFDPGTGTVPSPSAINTLDLKIGSGLFIAQDTPATNLMRLNQHLEVPNQIPQGVYGWDRAHDHNGNVTNRRAINTIITNGAQVSVNFNTPMSSEGMCYLSILALQYVQQSGITASGSGA